MTKILAVLEQREGKLKRTSFETASFAVQLANELQLEAEAVVIGGDIENLNEAAKYGLKKITHFKNSDLKDYSLSGYEKVLTGFASEISASYIVFANTSLTKDLVPSVTVKLNGGCIVDVIDHRIENGELIITRPIFAGKALQDVKLNSAIKIITIRPNTFKAIENPDVNSEIDIREIQNPDLRTRVIEFKKSEGKMDVAEADIIVSGGRGLKDPANFKLIEDLADVLGGAVGASRAVVDAGWRPHQEQVGQTGKTVSPSLYVACGISGAIQHLAGMSTSKYIVAINKDKDAPIFSIADYGIAGDIFEIVPALTDEIKKII